MMFVQTGAAAAGTKGILHNSVNFFWCNNVVYYRDKLPNAEQIKVQMLNCIHPEERLGFGDVIGELED